MMRALRHSLELLELPLPFLFRTRHGVLRHFPDKAFLEREEAPRVAERFLRASILRIAPAHAALRWVTMLSTPLGPSLRRFLDSPIVTSPSLWSGA